MGKAVLVKRRPRIDNPCNFGRPKHGPWKTVAQCRSVEMARDVAGDLLPIRGQTALFYDGKRIEFIGD